jgi:PKD repeat protein
MTEEHGPRGKSCPRCGALSPISDEFCNECGAQLPTITQCPACGEIVPPGETFCGSCGTPVSPSPSPPVQASTANPPAGASPAGPVVDRQQRADLPVSGKGPQKFIIPAIIGVVIIAVILAIVLMGLPALSKPGTNAGTPAPAVPTVSPAGTVPSQTPSVKVTSTTQGVSGTVSTIRAGFSTDRTSGSVPLTVSFTGSSSGSPDQLNWDFGDGTTSVEKNPVHTFRAPGTYTVTLDAGRNGQASSKTVVITVSPAPLTANFVADPTSGNAPLTVSFTDTSTGAPSTWIWELGNGQVSYDRNPQTTYYAAGSYTVQLTVEKSGIQNKKSMTIYVNPGSPSVPVVPVTSQQPVSVVTTTTSTPAGSIIGYWTMNVGSTTQYWTFNLPVGNSIDGDYGGPNYTTGTFTGTLSNGGTVVTGTYKEIISGATGTFRFTLTDANHLTGTVVKSGVTYQVTGYTTPI